MRTALKYALLDRPRWILGGSSLDLLFSQSLAAVNGGQTGLLGLISCARANPVTSLLPSSASGAPYLTFGNNVPALVPGLGLQVYQASTNNLLNSTAPVTQTTASLSTGTYTLWVNGAGSAAVSAGTATITGAGAATNGTPVTFTVTVAGTVTVTKTGALNAFQLEPGSFGTPLIVTAGSVLSRAADIITLQGQALTNALNAKAARFVSNGGNIVSNARFATWDSGQFLDAANATQVVATNAAAQLTIATLGSGTFAGLTKSAFGFDAATNTAIANAGTKATTANAWGSTSGNVTLGNAQAGTRAINGYLIRASFGPVKGQFDLLTSGANPA